MLRYNDTFNRFEGYTTRWEPLGHTNDLDADTKIEIDERIDEDIYFYTEGTQKMIISNNTNNSSTIGIGIDFNNPQSTLDIIGNLSVIGSNASFGSGIRIGYSNINEEGMIRYNNITKVFEEVGKSWTPLSNILVI